MAKQGPPLSYLFPKKATQSGCARTITAHTNQTNEHDDKQEDISNKHRGERFSVMLGVGYTAHI
jgi:hypothetical protein